MKIKPIAIALAIIATMLIVYVVFGISCLGEQKDQDDLSAKIDQLIPALAEKPPTSEELAQRLADAEEKLAAQQALIPAKLSSAEVFEAIAQLAQKSRVKALPLSTQPVYMEKVEESEYPVLKVSMEAEGKLPDLLAFIGMLEDGTIKALAVDQVSLSKAGLFLESQELENMQKLLEDIQQLQDLWELLQSVQQSNGVQGGEQELENMQKLLEDIQQLQSVWGLLQSIQQSNGVQGGEQELENMQKLTEDIQQLQSVWELLQSIQQSNGVQGVEDVEGLLRGLITNSLQEVKQLQGQQDQQSLQGLLPQLQELEVLLQQLEELKKSGDLQELLQQLLQDIQQLQDTLVQHDMPDKLIWNASDVEGLLQGLITKSLQELQQLQGQQNLQELIPRLQELKGLLQQLEELKKSGDLQELLQQLPQDIQQLQDTLGQQDMPDKLVWNASDVEGLLQGLITKSLQELQQLQGQQNLQELIPRLQELKGLLQQLEDLKKSGDLQELLQQLPQDIQQLQDTLGQQDTPDELVWNASIDIALYAQPIPLATALPDSQ